MTWMTALLAHSFAASFMPPAVSQIARDYNNLYGFLLWSSAIGCVLVIGGMIYFALKYKRKTENDKTAYITHNTFLEFLWSFIPLVIFLAMFVWGWKLYHDMRKFPDNALEVNVVAQQWSWQFLYKSGKTSTNEFWVPVNQPIKLIMASKDVIHSFYIPTMRIKQDVVPGRYTALWFESEKLGNFQVFCAEYCGTAHSAMMAKIHVVTLPEYEKWLQENDEGLSLAQKGEKLYSEKGCVACHSLDGTIKVGPSWKGIFGKTEEMADGAKVPVDENYIRESILTPNAKIVKGFAGGVMPAFQGQVTEEQMNALIEFIKGLK